jgi:two-component system sensor histidine kinase KdpD
MTEREVERVFDRFERGIRAGSAGGPGLGLAICRAIVRLHGGRAWADRPPAGGTAFHFSLPIETPPAIPAETADA